MQSKSIVAIFIAIMLIPILALFSNHEIFFWVLSLIILVFSAKNIYRLITGESLKSNDSDDEIEEELEELVDIDFKTLGTGLSVISSLLVILFLIYCAFYLEAFILKAVVTFAIILQVYFIVKKTEKIALGYSPNHHKLQIFMASLVNIAIILFTVLNKIYRMKP